MRYVLLLVSFCSLIYCKDKNHETLKPNGAKGLTLCHGFKTVPDGVGIYLYAGLIAEQARITGAHYAHITSDEPTLLPHTAEVLRPQFKLDIGFNGGLGYRDFHDKWDLGLDFTYLQSNANKCDTDTDCYYFYVPDCIWCHDLFDTTNHIDPTDSDDAPKICFDITLYNLDLMLRRAAYISTSVTIVPGFGLKNTWIDYSNNTEYCNVYGYNNCCSNEHGDFSIDVKNIKKCESTDFYGIGPQFGLDAKWYLTENFAFFSDFNAAFLVGRFKTSDTLYLDSVLKTCMKDGVSSMSPFLGLDIGIEYDCSCFDDSLLISAKLGYDNSVYFNQYNRICYTGICGLKENQNNTYSLTGVKFVIGLAF